MSDTLQSTVEFFQKANPEPSGKNISTQLGCHFEEVGEMIDSLVATTADSQNVLDNAMYWLNELSDLLKLDEQAVVIQSRIGLLDAIADQIVTATGSGTYLGMNVVGALGEVNRSNFSKFVDGKPLFDKNKKITKGPNYTRPDLTPYV